MEVCHQNEFGGMGHSDKIKHRCEFGCLIDHNQTTVTGFSLIAV